MNALFPEKEEEHSWIRYTRSHNRRGARSFCSCVLRNRRTTSLTIDDSIVQKVSGTIGHDSHFLQSRGDWFETWRDLV